MSGAPPASRLRVLALVAMSLGLVALLIGVAVGLAVGTSSSETTAPIVVKQEQAVTVHIHDFTYDPQGISVPLGAAVTWANEEDARHTATDRQGRWDTGTFKQNETATVSFDTPGTYDYICTVHPQMRGTLIVRG